MYLNRVYIDPYSEPPSQLRVVFDDIDFLMLVDINDDKTWPYRVEASEFERLGLEEIPDPVILITPEPNSKSEKARDRAFQTLSPLLDDYTELFDKRSRNKRIKALLDSVGGSRLYITRQLRRYWQRGMTPDALTPNYKNDSWGRYGYYG